MGKDMMTKVITGNRVRPSSILCIGILSLFLALGIFAYLFDAVFEAESVEDLMAEEGAVVLTLGLLSAAVAGFCFQIWFLAVAITVAMVETNKRLERMEYLMWQSRPTQAPERELDIF